MSTDSKSSDADTSVGEHVSSAAERKMLAILAADKPVIALLMVRQSAATFIHSHLVAEALGEPQPPGHGTAEYQTAAPWCLKATNVAYFAAQFAESVATWIGDAELTTEVRQGLRGIRQHLDTTATSLYKVLVKPPGTDILLGAHETLREDWKFVHKDWYETQL